jgi:hypothetical protein
VAGALLGRLTRFPDQCALQAPGKAVAGLMSGLVCGALLGLVEIFHPVNFNVTAIVAFLVSVNGTSYSATVGWWLRQAKVKGGKPCQVIEAMVIGMVATVAAGSLWVFGGPLIGAVDGGYYALLDAIMTFLPGAHVWWPDRGRRHRRLAGGIRFRLGGLRRSGQRQGEP